MSMGNGYVKRSVAPDLQAAQGIWTGGGAAANCTRASGDPNFGIASVNYNAATGKYLITFVDTGIKPIKADVKIHRAAAGVPRHAVVTLGSFSQSAKTLPFEVWENQVGVDTLVDLATTDKVEICVEFTKNKVDV